MKNMKSSTLSAEPALGNSLLYRVEDGIGIVTINRPERANAIDPPTAARFQQLVQEIEHDDGVGAVIVTGAGDKVFCAGSDLRARAEGVPPFVSDWGFAGFARAPRRKPYIAAVNGKAVGGGFEIVLACDLAIAAAHAQFSLPEVRHGVVAGGGGLVRLAKRVPPAVASEIIIAGAVITAERAWELGLVNRVVDGNDLESGAFELARRCLGGPPLAVSESLAVLRLAAGSDDPEVWARSAQASATVRDSRDGQEGPRAFAEKRAPVWTSRWSDCPGPRPAGI